MDIIRSFWGVVIAVGAVFLVVLLPRPVDELQKQMKSISSLAAKNIDSTGQYLPAEELKKLALSAFENRYPVEIAKLPRQRTSTRGTVSIWVPDNRSEVWLGTYGFDGALLDSMTVRNKSRK